MSIASILSDLWRGGGAFENPPPPQAQELQKRPRPNRVKSMLYLLFEDLYIILKIKATLLGEAFMRGQRL